MKQTKQQSEMARVAIQVWVPLATSLEKMLSKLFLKRDQYLNELFKREIEKLEAEFTASAMEENEFELSNKNSEAGYKVLKKAGEALDRKQINIFLEKEVASRINEILEKYNVPRDTFCNRVIYFLCAKDPVLLKGYLDEKDRNLDYQDELRYIAKMNRFMLAEECLLNPFSNIRENCEGKFYTIQNFGNNPDKVPNLYSFNTLIFYQTENGIEDLI